MESNSNKEIQAIVEQVKQTIIKIGHIDGYFISKGQVKVLESISGVVKTPQVSEAESDDELKSNLEAQLRVKLRSVDKEIISVELRLKITKGKEAAQLNTRYGQLLSERAKIKKQLTKLV